MKSNYVLSSLCYFSVFFAPLLFPIMVYFLASEDTKYHAKSAMFIHLVPAITGIGAFTAFAVDNLSENVTTLLIATVVVINVYYFILSVVKGVKVLQKGSIA
ncbi:hypothetical protein CAI16_14745 [Virgibacillus dokdonensis]|uniref:DUF4870 domain-containing protein n=1 Tax=Virgibacillus dokdonensis TaxID=302167 RepID=A0A3E0WMH1_9BACI|nr:DUF4870 domain-containing protein [Virgibacillus dokdonensis]RFA33403.1 hypothetical protein CAI16_14745 [Virgibacillus dokdonensis]